MMRSIVYRYRLLISGFMILTVLAWADRALATDLCPPDVDADGFVGSDDLEAALPILFAPFFTSPDIIHAADANSDRKVAAGDLIAIVAALGRDCSQPTATPTITSPPLPTPSPTGTPTASFTRGAATTTPPATAMATATATITRTPTATRTPTVTPNPTFACQPIAISPSTFAASLTASDCLRLVAGEQRPSDAYTLQVAANQEIAVAITAASEPALVPYVIVIDSSGRFGQAEGAPPVRFRSVDAGMYTIIVATTATSPVAVGDYQVQVQARACPTPNSLSLRSTLSASIAGDECIDPAFPSFGTRFRGVDLYDVIVNSVPANVGITMRQVSADDSIIPEMTLNAPSGALLVDDFDTIDCADEERECVNIRFLALEVGAYRLVASGSGRTGRYTMTVIAPTCRATDLGALPASGAILCEGQDGPGCSGVWSGDTRETPCAAPLIDVEGLVPENGSPSDLYAFTAEAGATVHIALASFDPFVYLIGPSSAGNPLIAAASTDVMSMAVITQTLAIAGTYTVIAANSSFLDPPDEDVDAELEDYELLIERVAP